MHRVRKCAILSGDAIGNRTGTGSPGGAPMMRAWMLPALLATLTPLAILLEGCVRGVAPEWRSARRIERVALLGVCLAGAAFLLLRPHDDQFAGLDVSSYRMLAQALADGREVHADDHVLAQVPSELRRAFLFEPRLRLTRDRAFELTCLDPPRARPYFPPLLPLAAGALRPALSTRWFVPLVGALWWTVLLLAGFRHGRGWGVLATSALGLGTAWPAWYLRGFYAEAVGGVLVASVVLAAASHPLRRARLGAAGMALGLATSYHPTLLVLAAPVALSLLPACRRHTDALWLLGGGALGIAPNWMLTRWVCQPYGDWTRLRSLWTVLWAIPEHRTLFLAGLALLPLILAALTVLAMPRARAALCRWDRRQTPFGWAAALLLAPAVAALLPGPYGRALRLAAVAVWSGIRRPFGLLLGVAAIAALRRGAPRRGRLVLTATVWATLAMLVIQGLETPVGLWSHRRMLPPLLLLVSVLTPSLAAGLAAPLSRWAPRGRLAALTALALAGGANLWRWPAAFTTIQDRGATNWTAETAARIGTNRWVVFDYYPHAVPYMADLQQRVLGLGEHARDAWPEVAAWLSSLHEQGEEVWVATSWEPRTLELGARLTPVERRTGQFPTVQSKAFFPAVRRSRTVHNTFSRWDAIPADDAQADRTPALAQDIVLDRGPIGLRGPWGAHRTLRASDGTPLPARWTREGSAVVGPVPPSGGGVRIRLEGIAGGVGNVPRTLRITTPWQAHTSITLPPGPALASVETVVARPADAGTRPPLAPTGLYVLTATEPYDPWREDRIRGYADDLGAVLHRIRIETLPPLNENVR